MRVTLLGTGTSMGVPIIGCACPVCISADVRDKRLRTAALVETDGLTITIDCGPDFRQQMLQHRVQHLDAVLFTHAHRDHTGGLDDVRAYNLWQQKPMPVYATQRVQQILKNHYDYVFVEDNKYAGAPNVELHTILNHPFTVNNRVTVTPIEALHGNDPVLGFRIHDFTYLTDASHVNSREEEKISGSKVLVLNALRQKKHWSHFNLPQALELINRLQIPKAYLTHISHQMGLHHEVESNLLPPHVRLAYDGLQITL